jgi:hypothetical protein
MTILLDAHVHFHRCFQAGGFLDAAWRNLSREAAASSQRCLCLTEGADEQALDRLRRAETGQAWAVTGTAETESLTARRRDGPELLLIGGRQIVTREGLEVLALGRRCSIADGAETREVITAIRADGAIPVLPWGFGKWTLRRRRLVAKLLEEEMSPGVFLGDNGGRAAGLPPSRLFALGAARRIWTLPGSDPLPFNSQQERVGSYACLITGSLDSDRPAASLRERLQELREQPPTFGRLQPLPAFLGAQARMQWRKRWKASA